MAVSVNSVVGFTSTAKYQHVARAGVGASVLKVTHFTSSSQVVGSRRLGKGKNRGLCLLVADDDRVATDNSDKDSTSTERSFVDDRSSAVNLASLDSQTRNSEIQTSAEVESGPQTPTVSSGSTFSSELLKLDTPSANIKSIPKRSSLTAREKLRAARVLSRYAEPKASKKPQLGSKVLEALKESDLGKKRSGLPEAPTNLFDDSKRGMPKQGLTFDFPGGADVLLIIFSFVFISTVMFGTTYIVWKVGAIHFNEY
ncbi:uncharacterized protein LOC132270772 isoform X2 [Cornus florida]|uniref:uncharacterized protein LOC132270772 isoform X2 n=1 Tax=Cornus florida TaxID=4283 RepID=UPI0028A0984C|nr:uncharacterized protein LOC132270772 isoform X2 [Cornus florida]